MTAKPFSLFLATEADTARFAAEISGILQPGDVLLLSGEIGAGKSAFARAVIRAKAGAEIEVPSPTFTLVQTYEFPDATIWHCDLYRLSHPDEAFELGLEDAFVQDICLIEWPDRLGNAVPEKALTLAFLATPHGHRVEADPETQWSDRLAALHV